MINYPCQLLAPAGNWECAQAAIENGADAIYFGLERFNARMRAENFTQADLPRLMAFLHRRGVRGYVTLNTLVFAGELAEAEKYLRTLISSGVDAVIVQDIGLCRLIRHLSPDFPIHASTQMTITSSAGVAFAQNLGCELVVLARECSIKEITKIKQQIEVENIALPLEVFVHGALCVAYSGQCLTSESLGGRSANRGECAQACRMPYDLIADGQVVELGEQKYLLSPQDLSGLEVLEDLVNTGISCLKIEGRLKSPEYVANVTRVYRQALDQVLANSPKKVSLTEEENNRYQLEMAFSRGLYTGWFQGINNQALVHGRFAKKRGVYLGEVSKIKGGEITVKNCGTVKPGDGLVFDSGNPEIAEIGGRVYSVEQENNQTILTFSRQSFDSRKVNMGDQVWKTSDPELDKKIRQTYSQETPQYQRPIDITIHGETGTSLTVIAQDEMGNIVQLDSEIILAQAENQPLTTERIKEQLGRLGNTPFYLRNMENNLSAAVMLPVKELNRLRREIVTQLEQQRSQPKRWNLNSSYTFKDLLPTIGGRVSQAKELIVLVRNLEQLNALLDTDIQTIYCEFEDIKKYKEAVKTIRQSSTNKTIWVAPPRISKPAENYILKQVLASEADGYLMRNYDHLNYFAGERCRGDFSLNIANPLTAEYFINQMGLEKITASYDLNIQQLEDLITTIPPHWLEITIHQRMPMFHMEHCVFCAFLSTGTDFTNCGRPCEKYQVKLRDRVGTEHILKADAGCRNTLYNGNAQTAAEYIQHLQQLGIQSFRLEFLNETPHQMLKIIQNYQQLLLGKISGSQLWQTLKLTPKLGVTRGTLAKPL